MLEQIFISYHFDELPRKLVAKIETLIRASNLKPITGNNNGGGALDAVIEQKIRNCDAMIYILSDRDPGQSNDWVMHEVSTAKAAKIPSFGLIQDGLSVPSHLRGYEYHVFDNIESSDLWIKLSATLNIWMQEKGKSIEANIEPAEIVSLLRSKNIDNLNIEYQLLDDRYNRSEWKSGKIKETEGGISVLLEEVLSNSSIVLKITDPSINKTWKSIPISQELTIKLKE